MPGCSPGELGGQTCLTDSLRQNSHEEGRRAVVRRRRAMAANPGRCGGRREQIVVIPVQDAGRQVALDGVGLDK